VGVSFVLEENVAPDVTMQLDANGHYQWLKLPEGKLPAAFTRVEGIGLPDPANVLKGLTNFTFDKLSHNQRYLEQVKLQDEVAKLCGGVLSEERMALLKPQNASVAESGGSRFDEDEVKRHLMRFSDRDSFATGNIWRQEGSCRIRNPNLASAYDLCKPLLDEQSRKNALACFEVNEQSTRSQILEQGRQKFLFTKPSSSHFNPECFADVHALVNVAGIILNASYVPAEKSEDERRFDVNECIDLGFGNCFDR
jgi:hypothetical protein